MRFVFNCDIIRFMKKKKIQNKLGNRAFYILVFGMTVMAVVSVISLALLSYFTGRVNTIETEVLTDYAGHYVFISDKEESDIWEEVYAAASIEAAGQNIYIEYPEKTMGVNYTNKELFRVAINSSVDGIIYGGTPDDEMVELIDKAVDEKIGVILLQNDADTSKRQCFVGVNNYELGQVYASQIEKMFSPGEYGGVVISLLVNDDMSEGAVNVFTIALKDYLLEKYPEYTPPEIEAVRINAQDVFRVEEDIRNYMLGRDLPDAMICLSSTYTQCVYQALVDLNRVGETQIIGYFSNDTILDAVEKQVIFSTVSIDTQQMGINAVKALEEYRDSGYTNSYMPVSMSVIGKKEAGEIIAKNEAAKN